MPEIELAKQSPAAIPPSDRYHHELFLKPKCRKYKDISARAVAIGYRPCKCVDEGKREEIQDQSRDRSHDVRVEKELNQKKCEDKNAQPDNEKSGLVSEDVKTE